MNEKELTGNNANWEKLSDDELESIDGGLIKVLHVPYRNRTTGEIKYGTRYKVFNKKGEAVGTYDNVSTAVFKAHRMGTSLEIIDTEEYPDFYEYWGKKPEDFQ